MLLYVSITTQLSDRMFYFETKQGRIRVCIILCDQTFSVNTLPITGTTYRAVSILVLLLVLFTL